MKLKELVEMSKGKLIGNVDLEINIENFSIDSRVIGDNCVFVPLKGENTDGHNYINSAFEKGAVGTFSSQDVNVSEGKFIIKVDDVLLALQETARNLRKKYSNIPIVALTGSVGKTTTKDMIYAVLSQKYKTLKTQGNFNNGIGLPLTLLSYKDEEMMVLEMGMNSFGEISLLSEIAKPDTALILNVGKSHIGNLGSRENILKAKMEIIEGMAPNTKLALNIDNDLLSTVKDIPQEIVTFGYENDAQYYAYDIKVNDFETEFFIKENNNEYKVTFNLSGKEFVHNALAAWTIGALYDVSPEDRCNALKNCEYTKMRMNIKKVKEYTLINDCYNASIESMNVALDTLARYEGRKVAILGDILELGEYTKDVHEEVGKKVADNKIDLLILAGENVEYIKDGAIKNGMKAEQIFMYKNANEICQIINEKIKNRRFSFSKGFKGYDV